MTTFADAQSDAVAGAIRNRRTVHRFDPEREMLVGLVWYGFAAEVPRVRRKPVRDILHRRP